MRVRRDVSSIPHRSASDTWRRIGDLVTGAGSTDVDQIEAATGVMATVITDEHPANAAIVLKGVGAQLRIYCRYGMKAVEHGDAVDALAWNPTAGNWTMHVPCDAANLSWVRDSLKKTSPRIRVFDVASGEHDAEQDDPGKSEAIVVDWNMEG